MGGAKEKMPKDGGFGAMLAFAILFTLGALICLILLCILAAEVNDKVFFIIMFSLTAGFGFYAVLGYLGAIVGVRHKWADVLLIIFAAPLCLGLLGLLAVIGGAVAIKDINNPQRISDRKNRQEKNAGFGLRLAFAIILAVISLPFILMGNRIFGGEILSQIFMMLALILVPLTVLQFVAAFVGKKKKGANIISIIIGSLFAPVCGLGALGIVGGVRGVAPFKRAAAEAKAQAEEEEKAKLLAEQNVLEKGEGEIQTVTADVAASEEEEAPECIQPKMGAKGKKAIMITLAVSYSLLLLMGILLAAVPAMSKIISGIGICEEISARAYGITIGVMWVALVPSFGYYFATVSPLELSKKVKIIISAVCAALSVAMVVIFFVIINAVKIEGVAAVKEFYEDSDSWFIPLSMVFAALGLMICHALTLFKINPAKIRNKKPEKCGDGFMSMLKHVFALLIYGIIGLVKFILTCKEKQPDIFILVSTVLLTWLAHFASFVFAIICIAVLIGVVVMYFAGVISFAYSPDSASGSTLTVDGKPVTEQNYVIDDRYQKVYKDDNGNEYISDDGGKTVREYHRYDD